MLTPPSGSCCLLRLIFLLSVPAACVAQGSAALGNGFSAAAIARGATTVAEAGGTLDAMEGNPAGLRAESGRALELGAVGLTVGGDFDNAVNRSAKPRGLAGAVPYGAFSTPLGHSRWTASVAVTPEILMRANWHYVDAPGTAGVSYGYQTQETQIIAMRSALGLARSFGRRWNAGATLGVVYNQNDLHAPYIFQQQPQLAGLKVLLSLTTRGYGWNGGAGLTWQPSPKLRAGLAWKSGTTIRTQGHADGSASALFHALGISSDASFRYHAQVENHLPQAGAAGLSWQVSPRLRIAAEGDFTAWQQAFHTLPISLTGGTNETINSVVGSNNFKDFVPLHWRNQGALHAGVEAPLGEAWSLRAGYSYLSDPVPSLTLTPLTAAVMQHAVAAGTGFAHGRWHYDAAYQAQLPSSVSVSSSGLLAGEYSNSHLRVWTQSLTLTTGLRF